MMADSDDEAADIANVLLEPVDTGEDPFSFNDGPVTKKRKSIYRNPPQIGSLEGFDLFSNDAPLKSKVSGSAFKTMGIFA
jgi:hypothetical protein